MRHGRKSKSVRFCGYKRHVLRDLDTELVRAVGLTLANAPESSVTPSVRQDLTSQGVELRELHIDRAYLSSELVRERPKHFEPTFCTYKQLLSRYKRLHRELFAAACNRFLRLKG